jgi:hypothetical protein
MQTTRRKSGPRRILPCSSRRRRREPASTIDFRLIADKSLSLIVVADYTGTISTLTLPSAIRPGSARSS